MRQIEDHSTRSSLHNQSWITKHVSTLSEKRVRTHIKLIFTVIIITEATTAEMYIVDQFCAERADSPCRLYKHSQVVSVLYFLYI